MNQFYLPDAEAAKKCEHSRDNKVRISVSGADTMDRRLKLYDGVIQAVEDFGPASKEGRRWRATII